MSKTTRRTFIRATASALAGAGAMGSTRRVRAEGVSANEKLTIGVIGLRNQGRNDMHRFLDTKQAQVAWVADPDDSVARGNAQEVAKRQGKAPKAVRDFRAMLDAKDVDAVVIATPDHWHAISTILACQAGKDVYVEKPASHNVKEGREMVEAARKHNRVVQVGSHQRSAEHYQQACEYARSGKLGKIAMAKAGVIHERTAIGVKPDCEAPKGVDYDLWLGPAPKRPFNPNRFHYNWHWWWDYGTGEMGNWAAHHLDILMWYLELDYPTAVSASGGTFVFDDREVPDTQIVLYDYPKLTVVWEQRLWTQQGGDGVSGANVYGSDAAMMVDRGGWEVRPDDKKADRAQHKGRTDLKDHVQNFIDCVKSRKRPNADIEDGHRTAVMCHLGNIATRLKRRLVFDGKTETFVGDAEANTYLTREYRKPYELPSV
ncbi:MAG: Gfo/Idh/MocA family oxidoreductase [Phycisphaerae bacterium]|nr:Gfo/Idh/MocA family oxidoreductase [Phycisphaerae bacterium]